MRQFLLGKNVACPTTAKTYLDVPDGAIGIFIPKEDGDVKLVEAGTEIKGMANIVLGRSVAKGGPVVIPFNSRDFQYNKGTHEAATTFQATIEIPEITNIGTYSLICVKKGKVFNDRHKWTSDVYVRNISMSTDELAEALAKHINDNTIGNSLTAEVTKANKENSTPSKLTITAVHAGEDYNIVPADELMGTEVTIVKKGIPAYADAKYITDLAYKAAADAGFEYTFEEDIKMYPAYPLNPLAQDDTTDSGFVIFNLVFYEGREVKNVDQVVRQLVQIALPKDATTIINNLDGIFAAIV